MSFASFAFAQLGDPLHVQGLAKVRETYRGKSLLERANNFDDVGASFWKHVAARFPDRTAEDCLDAFIQLNRCPVTRFSSSRRSSA